MGIINFVCFLAGDEPEDFEPETPKIYELVPSLELVEERLKNFMEQYNETVRGGKMDLVFFKVSPRRCYPKTLWFTFSIPGCYDSSDEDLSDH